MVVGKITTEIATTLASTRASIAFVTVIEIPYFVIMAVSYGKMRRSNRVCRVELLS